MTTMTPLTEDQIDALLPLIIDMVRNVSTDANGRPHAWVKFARPLSDAFPNMAYSEARAHVDEWLATHTNQMRSTHTDIALRELAGDLARCVGKLEGTVTWDDGDYQFIPKQ